MDVDRPESHPLAGFEAALAAVHYDYYRGECDLLRLAPAKADEVIEAYLDAGRGLSLHQVEGLRATLSDKSFYDLLFFAKRAVARALRGDSRLHMERALQALAWVDTSRIDWRDHIWSCDLWRWGVVRFGLPKDELVARVQHIATPELMQRLEGERDYRTPLIAGYREVVTAYGPGLMLSDRGFEPAPEVIAAALAIAAAIEGEPYSSAKIWAWNTCPVFSGSANTKESLPAAQRIAGCLIVDSRQSIENPGGGSVEHLLMCYLVEAESSSDAQELERAAERPFGEEVSLVVRRGRFLAILLARPTRHGAQPVETTASLQRFLLPLERALGALD